jgi:hypothetical protein
MFPVFCLLCRCHVPRAISDDNAGYCLECRNYTLQETIRTSGRYERNRRPVGPSNVGVL